MRVMIKRTELYDLAVELQEISNNLEDISRMFVAQTEKEVDFQGQMADAYQNYIRDLMKQHEKMIQYYQQLSNDLKEMVQDFDEQEDLLLTRIENI